jgi:hypothetical protein
MNKFTNFLAKENLEDVVRCVVSNNSESMGFDHAKVTMMQQRNWAFGYYLKPRLLNYFKWLEESDESSNYTYNIRNISHLVGWISCVTNADMHQCVKAVEEILSDQWCLDFLVAIERQLGSSESLKQLLRLKSGVFGRRIGWYAVVRLLKPKLVVETGVDRGLGSVILCRALMRNEQEGFLGRYIGTEIDPQAGRLLRAPLDRFGKILYGDSICSLNSVGTSVDVFINDSDHSEDYEGKEYLAIENKLSERAVILGDNCHVTDKLFEFACSRGMRFAYFAEQLEDHWYPGAGIGAAF